MRVNGAGLLVMMAVMEGGDCVGWAASRHGLEQRAQRLGARRLLMCTVWRVWLQGLMQ